MRIYWLYTNLAFTAADASADAFAVTTVAAVVVVVDDNIDDEDAVRGSVGAGAVVCWDAAHTEKFIVHVYINVCSMVRILNVWFLFNWNMPASNT